MHFMQNNDNGNGTVVQSAPVRREHVKRMTDALRAMPVDFNVAHRVDRATAGCLRIYARNNGWKITQKKDGDSLLVWRVG